MTVAIIGAYQVDDAGVPLALLPFAGMPLAEHQARRAAAAGATPVILLVEGASIDFAELIGRLRHDGISAEICDGLAALQGPSDDPILLIANGCLPDPPLLAAALAAPRPNVAAIVDAPGLDRFERIDADARWAGVAMIESDTVTETAAMLGGWDPVSTLLRRTLQQGAGRIDAGAPPLMVERAGDLIGAERALIVTSRLPHDDWIAQSIFMPIEDRALPWLLTRPLEPAWLMAGSAILALIAGLAALLGLRWPVLVALLLVGPAAAVAKRLARIQARAIANRTQMAWARRAGGALALCGLGWSLTTQTGQWGWLLIAAIAIAALSGLAAERTVAPPRWYASPRTLAWELLPFALVGRWQAGFAVLAFHAAASFAAALATRRRDQRRSTGT